MKRQTIKKIVSYTGIMILALGFFASMVPARAYICKEGDTECEEAMANMEAKQNEANNYSNRAQSVAEVIKQLEAEISMINAAIAENEAEIKTLNVEIEQTKKRLLETQEALAEMLIEIHFSSDAEPIMVLAGSRSISDYAEKAAREEVAKREIAALSERIKTEKEKLDQKKAEVEAKLAANEQNRSNVAAKKESQAALKLMYEKNADEANKLAAAWEDKVREMAWTPPSNTVGFGERWWDGPGDTYPESGACWSGYNYWLAGNERYPYGGLICQCTDYVSWKAVEKFGIWNDWHGDAWMYAYAGSRTGYTGRVWTDNTPAPNSIAVWPQSCWWDGGIYVCDYGHVAWVESVNNNGSINITEYNVSMPSWNCYAKDFCSRKGVGSSGLTFVHFR